MGTNYYLRKQICDTCGHAKEKTHIGKHSDGWRFLFRGYGREHGDFPSIKSFTDWKRELQFGRIFTEYGEEVSHAEFIALVDAGQNETSHREQTEYNYGDYTSGDGYDFCDQDFS